MIALSFLGLANSLEGADDAFTEEDSMMKQFRQLLYTRFMTGDVISRVVQGIVKELKGRR
jgi:hypothetical protein